MYTLYTIHTRAGGFCARIGPDLDLGAQAVQFTMQCTLYTGTGFRVSLLQGHKLYSVQAVELTVYRGRGFTEYMDTRLYSVQFVQCIGTQEYGFYTVVQGGELQGNTVPCLFSTVQQRFSTQCRLGP